MLWLPIDRHKVDQKIIKELQKCIAKNLGIKEDKNSTIELKEKIAKLKPYYASIDKEKILSEQAKRKTLKTKLRKNCRFIGY